MNVRKDELSNKQYTLNWLSFIYIIVTIGVYFIYAINRNNYWDALVMPVIFGFIWMGLYRQKFKIAVGLVAIYIMIAMGLISAGYMTPYTLTNLIIMLIIVSVGYSMYVLSWGKSIAIIGLLFLGIVLSYLFDFLESYLQLTLLSVCGLGLLSKYLLEVNSLSKNHNK